MHQRVEGAERESDGTAALGDKLCEALRTLLTPKGIVELAVYCEAVVTLGEVAARLDDEAVRSERAAEDLVARSWYHKATAERERAEELRRQATARREIVVAGTRDARSCCSVAFRAD
jgi:hypothetical protein